ncbi:MAG TPA: histidine phosphatase family protein [Solirubrobacterales bacterium]|nr:histidine phosphatase family protein [Solirubrobacterales bacterium]
MVVHFVRHGESASNAAPGAMALPGNSGDRLTERGFEQVRAVSERLGEAGATRVLTSPLRRARETAGVIAERLELPVTELAELRELRESEGFGELSLEDQRLRRWSVWMAEHGDDPDHSYRGGESFNEIMSRVQVVQERLVADGTESVIAVSHGIFLRFFLMRVLFGREFQPSQVRSLWQLASLNCGICGFEYRERDLETNYATEPWRCFSWMAPAPTRPPR